MRVGQNVFGATVLRIVHLAGVRKAVAREFEDPGSCPDPASSQPCNHRSPGLLHLCAALPAHFTEVTGLGPVGSEIRGRPANVRYGD